MWTLTQRADMPDLAAANTQMLEDLENGASGISLVLPGSVNAGSHGVAVSDAKSLERLFDGVELDFISVRLDAGRNGRDLALLVLGEYKRRLLDLSRCRLDLGLDPLGALALNGRIVNRAELARRAGEMFTTAKSMDQTGASSVQTRAPITVQGVPKRRNWPSPSPRRSTICACSKKRDRTRNVRAAHLHADDGRCRPVPDHGQAARRPPDVVACA
jgi:hypothetical protein